LTGDIRSGRGGQKLWADCTIVTHCAIACLQAPRLVIPSLAMSATDSLPDDVETLQRLLRIRDAELGRARAQALSAEALIAHLQLAIEKMRRELYGQRAERKAPFEAKTGADADDHDHRGHEIEPAPRPNFLKGRTGLAGTHGSVLVAPVLRAFRLLATAQSLG
jgi:hypothetical protein